MPCVHDKCGKLEIEGGGIQNSKQPIPFLQKEMHHIAFQNKGCTPYTSPVTQRSN
jgi:hypothetical protein